MIKYFLFDLDNTLYSPNEGPLKEVDRLMTEYIVQNYNYSFEDAQNLRKQYYQQYGTTMEGLIVNFKINPYDFLEFVHDVDDKYLPKEDKKLQLIMESIQCPIFILTNSYYKYAQKVVKALGIEKYIEKIFDIQFMEFKNKIHRDSYIKVTKYIDKKAYFHEFVMFDDIWKYLKEAKELNIKTVLVNKQKNGTPHFHINNIHEITKIIDQLYEN